MPDETLTFFDGALTVDGPAFDAASMVELSEQQIMDQIAARLSDMYDRIPAQDVARLVHREHARFDGRPIRDFVPLFVERHAKEELARIIG